MTKAQLQEDVIFLSKRSLRCGSVGFGNNQRDTGISSNSIVAIAYGIITLKDQCMPGDLSDMLSIDRMWDKLPIHRKSKDVKQAYKNAKECGFYGCENYKKS